VLRSRQLLLGRSYALSSSLSSNDFSYVDEYNPKHSLAKDYNLARAATRYKVDAAIERIGPLQSLRLDNARVGDNSPKTLSYSSHTTISELRDEPGLELTHHPRNWATRVKAYSGTTELGKSSRPSVSYRLESERQLDHFYGKCVN